MEIFNLGIKYKQAPLPFAGQKKRYIKQFQKIINRLPHGARVFDAFGGSSLLARIAKDTRPDLDVFTNDFERLYRNRLAVVNDTNRVLRELWDAGAYRDNNEYSRYDAETEARLKEIVATGKDVVTCKTQIYCKQGNTVRAHARTVPYDEQLCKNWYYCLTVCNSFIEHDIYNTDVYILDPPYRNKGITKREKIYSDENDATECAREFCMECIENGRKIILFDDVEGGLIDTFTREFRGNFDAYIPEYAKGIYCKDMMITNIVE